MTTTLGAGEWYPWMNNPLLDTTQWTGTNGYTCPACRTFVTGAWHSCVAPSVALARLPDNVPQRDPARHVDARMLDGYDWGDEA